MSDYVIDSSTSYIVQCLRGAQVSLPDFLFNGVGNFVSCLLLRRNVNLMDLAEVLPRNIASSRHRYQYLDRLLSEERLDEFAVMSCLAKLLFLQATSNERTAIISLDQSQIRDGIQILMLSIRVHERAIPLLWEVVETGGAIGWDVQHKLLTKLYEIIPIGCNILLLADRFYGTAKVIEFCQKRGFSYRIRLKDNLILHHEAGEISTGDAVKKKISILKDAELNDTGIKTNIGILHEAGHKEAWIIAMECLPNQGKILDYGMRWSIEAMFSDTKSRGFNIAKTKLLKLEKISRLVLMITIAMITAVTLAKSQILPHDKIKNIKKKSAPYARS